MTTPELIELFFLPAHFRPPLGDQFGDGVAAFRCLPKSSPKTLKRSEPRFHQQAIVLDTDIEDIALAEAKFFAHLRWDHDASLFTYSHFCHQDLNVAEQDQNGNE